MAESEEELKNFLMKVKEESEKASLKLNIQKTKIMASGPSLHDKLMGKKWKKSQISSPPPNLWSSKPLCKVIVAMKLKDIYSLEGKLRQT